MDAATLDRPATSFDRCDPMTGEVASTAAAMMAHLDGRLARHTLPEHITPLDALPRTGPGKAVKAEPSAPLMSRL